MKSSLLNALGATLSIFLIPQNSASGAIFTGLGDLPGGIFRSDAAAVSADGTVVAGRSTSEAGDEGFLWRFGSDGMVGLGDLPGGHYSSTATGISADGNVVVGTSHSNSGDEGFRWTPDDGMRGLGDLHGGSFSSYASGVSASGKAVVGFSSSNVSPIGESFRWSRGAGM